MERSREEGAVWSFFEAVDFTSIQCKLCRSYSLSRVQSSTTNLLKHLRQKHPEEVPQWTSEQEAGDTDADVEQIRSVEVSLDGEDSEICPLNEAASSSIVPPLQEDSTETEHAMMKNSTRNKRSLIWKYFVRLDGVNTARCSVCSRALQCSESGSTGNLRRHMFKRHPKVYSEMTFHGPLSPALSPKRESNSNKEPEKIRDTDQMKLSEEVSLVDEDSDNISSLNEAAVNSIMAPLQEDPTEMIEQKGMSNSSSAGRTRNRRSLIWEYFVRLDGLDAACCSICSRKLQCCESSGTSNLRRHILKRHPEVYSEITRNGNHPPVFNPKQESEYNKKPEKFCDTDEMELPGTLKVSQSSEGEKRVFMQERELIEALRRTQREEARTLEHQRELMEKLRTADAREAAAEREKIEMLRKAQQEETEDLRRQREELQKEKAELQEKWEELRQEREDFLLISK